MALPLLFAACASAPAAPPTPPPPPTPDATPAPAPSPSPAVPSPSPAAPATSPAALTPIAEPGDHGFAARLYASQASAHSGNLILSPASARLALGMAYLGARGDTAREMAAALGLPTDASQAGAEMSASVKAWNDHRDPKVKLAIANALFEQRGWPVEEPYASALRDGFAARLQVVDFAGDAAGATRAINLFAASNTKNEITHLVQEGDLTPRTRLALVNATYFKGEWKTAFPASSTASGTFHAPDENVTRPLMHVEGYFSYGETSDAQVLVMPYGSGTYSMVVVLPGEQVRLAALERRMTGAVIDAWFACATPGKVNVTLPRFELETQSELGDALAGMGMRQAFDVERADFSGITRPTLPGDRLYISKVIQKAKVKVDEKGTVAAAATVVGMAAPPSAPPPVPTFTADHPFLYFIRDGLGNVLFMGRVVEP
jgi:serpin B